jgi:hypothetical protein
MYTNILTVPDRVIRAQQAPSTHHENIKYDECVLVYIVAMLCVVLAVMCISVIYKFLSLGL